MSSRALKRQVLDLIAGPDLAAIRAELARLAAKDVINILFSAICREDERTRWHAVTCMGDAVARLAGEDLEAARIVMRRLLWSLNDESGGIGWGAPETMAEILCRHQGLGEEYVHMLISYMREDGEELCQDGNFLEHPLLQRGLLWGMARLSRCRPDLLQARGAEADIAQYLSADDAATRGLAIVAMRALGLAACRPQLELLRADTAPLTLYEEGVFLPTAVGELARSALEALPR